MNRPDIPCHVCGNLQQKTTCDNCTKKIGLGADRKRTQSLYDARWRAARLTFLSDNPCCAECDKLGITTIAEHVHHSQKHHGNYEVFWDQSKWIALCASHHNAISARGG